MNAVTVRVARFDPATGRRSWSEYRVELQEKTTVLDCAERIQRDSDPTLAFRYACRVGMCGSCAMVVNGKERWTCRTLVRNLGSPTVTLEPLRHFPVIRDLAVDFAPMWSKYRQIRPDFVPSPEAPPAKTRQRVMRDRRVIDPHIQCISCGACYSSCGYVGMDPEYLGPHALNRVFTLVADSRDGARDLRLDLVDNEHGCWKCHIQKNCTETCPVDISPSAGIQELKQSLVERRLLTPSRRKFVYAALGAAVSAVVAYIAIEPPREWRAVGNAEEFRSRGMVVLRAGSHRMFVYTDGGGFAAIGQKCTHQGCLVQWNQDTDRFVCDCHAGHFLKNGEVAGGPPVRRLPVFETRVVDGILEVLA